MIQTTVTFPIGNFGGHFPLLKSSKNPPFHSPQLPPANLVMSLHKCAYVRSNDFFKTSYIQTYYALHSCITHQEVSLRHDRARTTVTFPIDDHYIVFAPTLKIYPTIFFLNSQKMTDPLRHLVCEIRENDIPPFRTNCFNA